jgi:catechol 2,3-dioxygenase-like lactoylglutathione lyase family enzyme
MTHPSHEEMPAGELPEIPDMPNFAILVVNDLDRSLEFYTEGLGFWVEKQLDGPDGQLAIVHLRRAQFRDLLLRPAREPLTGERGKGVRLSFACFDETEASLREVAERTAALPFGSVEGPLSTPWNTVDVMATDPDGYVIVISTVADVTRTDWSDLQQRVRSGEEVQPLA